MVTSVPDDRALTSSERHLIAWLLEHGTDRARYFVPQVSSVRVVSRCGCGCASIDFLAIRPPTTAAAQGIEVLADYRWDSPHGNLFGVFVFARGGSLAGLEVWSIDGTATPGALPDVHTLRPIDA